MFRKILFDIYMILFYPVICRSQFRIRYFGDLYRLSYGMVNAALDRTSRLLRVLMYKCAEDCGLGSKEERTYYEKEKYYMCLSLCLLSMTMGMLGGCGGKEQNEAVQTGEAAVEEADTGVDSEEEAETDKAGQSAGIVFEAQDLEGNIVTEEVFADSRLTMVNVWATYCNPCLSEMPELGELAGEYATEEFQIIGIISDVQEGAELENTVYAATLVEQTGAAYPHLLLNESLFNAMLSGVSAVPTTFFVDENGEVLDTVVGAMDKDSWKEKIDGLLKE